MLEYLAFGDIILSQNVRVIALEVLVRTVFVQTGRVFEEELAVLGPSERSPHESAVVRELVQSQNGQ